MLRVRAAFDPRGLCNPGKVIPMLRGCGEGRALLVEHSDGNSSSGEILNPPRTTSRKKNTSTVFNPDNAAHRIESIVAQPNVKVQEQTVVVHPGSLDEISELMQLASSDAWTVRPAGSMTWLVDTAATNLTVSTSRLNQFIEHEPADLVAIAQAGVLLATFNAELATNGQWLPLDPPDDGRATLGGVVATGLGGMQQIAYGRPRGSVIGMKVILADGSLVKAGGRVVKNVAGYDLCKLFTGSYGTLGIITELNFKLRPRPECQRTMIVHGNHADLISAGQRILASGLFPVAAELLSAALARRIGIETKLEQAVLLLRFAGHRKAVEFQTRTALAQFAESKAESIDNDEPLWSFLAAVPLIETEALTWRASVLPSALPKCIESLIEIYRSSFFESFWQMGIGDGRIRMIERADTDYTEKASEVFHEMSGYFVIERAELDFESSALMKRVKDQLDPGRVFPTLA
jgi:FAD/FMN-containing dehydrogenase